MNISLYDAVIGGFELKRIIHSVALMNTISHQIERQILKDARPIDLYAGFERLSFFEAQKNTYAELDRVCESVTVFGIADVTPPPFAKTDFTALETDSPLAREWFIVVDTAEFWTLLSTQELSPDPITGKRRFEGVWTFDAVVVARASRYLRHVLGRPIQTITRRQEASQERHIADMRASMLEQMKRKGSPLTQEYIDTKAFPVGR